MFASSIAVFGAHNLIKIGCLPPFVAILIFKTGKQLDDKDKFITGI
jgi:hypothetical protein